MRVEIAAEHDAFVAFKEPDDAFAIHELLRYDRRITRHHHMRRCDRNASYHSSDEPVLLYRFVEFHVLAGSVRTRILEAERLERLLRGEAQANTSDRMIILSLENARCEQRVLEPLGEDRTVAFEELHHTHDIRIEFVEKFRNTIEVS